MFNCYVEILYNVQEAISLKNGTYTVKSRNTLEYISFHDCVIKHSEWDNSNLILYFDWLDILQTHPNNDTGKAKQTDSTVVCFENVKVITSQWHDHSKAIANAFEKKKNGDTSVFLNINIEEIEIKDIDFLDALNDLDIISLNIEKTDEKYICKIDGTTTNYTKKRKIEFEYSDVYICFNNFTSNAWFEGAK